MKTYLFFDTETTGLPNYGLDTTSRLQPWVTQLGMILADETGHEIAAIKTPIMPDGWEIDERAVGDDGKPTAFSIHGLTNEFLTKYGMSTNTALIMFQLLSQKASMKVAHNYAFDGFMMKSVRQRQGMADMPEMERFCTMKAMRDIMKLNPTEKMVAAGYNTSKPPKLSEAYEYCTGKPLEKAHDAFVDVRACKEIFFWILNNGHFVDQPRFKPQENAA